ncbi:MAG TPA: ABC transporter permease [Thermoanaerobaculia bacterium]
MLRIHWLEIKYEFIKMLRMPQYSLPTLFFPVVFYIFFALVFNGRSGSGMSIATYMLATYGAFGVIGASLFGFGVGVAIERGQGWLQVKRTTPMPFSAYIVAKVAMSLVFSTIIVLALLFLGTTFGGVHIGFARALGLVVVLVSGSLTFCALGMAIGYFAGPNSAAPIVNLIYLPMSFLSGLWVPIWALPRGLQRLAFFLPPFHFAQLALRVIGGGRGLPAYVHVIAMTIATAIFLFVAYSGYRRDEGKMYG